MVSTGSEPGTLEDKTYAGKTRPPSHSAAPYYPDDPNYKGDHGGIIHIFANMYGTAADVGLYRPPGGRFAGGGEYPENRKAFEAYGVGATLWSNTFRWDYSEGPLKELTIKLNHVGGTHGGHRGGATLGRFPGETNGEGSVRIGSIGGIGGNGPGYVHSHVEFSNTKTGKRVDPRGVFCKQFGFK
jgi:hypothetical protein